MEVGLKKLWSRKKSWGAADQPLGPRKVSISNSVLSQSTMSIARDGRPSMASTRPQPGLNVGPDGSSGLFGGNAVNNNDELGRTKSGHRIQPMLVGISRPPTGKDRPDTAGSLQLAVQKAADSINRRPSEAPAVQPVQVKQSSHTKPVVRHVDIFSVAASTPSYRSRYNEEIAERNLDTYRLVLENTPYIYDPSSKYQEEVAIRNAYLPYRSRTGSDARRSQDHDRGISGANKTGRGGVTPQPNGSHSYHSSTVSADLNQRSLQDQPFQSGQSNPRSRDGTHVPSMPQTQPDELASARGETLKIATQVSSPQSPQRTSGPLSHVRENRMSTIAEGQLYEARPSTGTGIWRHNGNTPSRLPDYRISETEYRVTDARSTPSDRTYDLGLTGEAPLMIPHARGPVSVSKRTIVLPNRTIMDLTGEDHEMVSETSSAFGYSQYSPVIEQAQSDAVRRIQPSQIHTEERRGSRGPSQLQTPIDVSYLEPSTRVQPVINYTVQRDVFTPTSRPVEPDLQSKVEAGVQLITNLEPPARLVAEPDSELEPEPEPEPIRSSPPVLTEIHPAFKMLSPSTFSPISTMASWSPRSSAYIANPPEPISMTARVAAALEASRAISKEALPSVSGKRGIETPTVRERVASFESTTERTVTPQPPASESNSSAVQTAVPVLSMTPAKPIRHPVNAEATKNSVGASATPVASIPSVYASPESITSVDHNDSNGMFGVRTRDFALVPQKSVSTLQKERPVISPQIAPVATKNLEQKPKSAGKTRSKRTTPAVSKPKEPGFDEDAFARKQADARAALERLQQSLSEDFLTLPDRNSVKSSKGKEPERTQSRQTAPTIIQPPETKASGPTGVTQKPEADRPPPSSYRNSRGEQQRSSLTSNRSLSASSKSSRRAPAPAILKHVEPATHPIDQNTISPALLHAVHLTSKAPRSPGEISLSSFPVPSSSRPPSQPDVPVGYHSHNNSYASAVRRRNSQSSTTSGFSIPLHMVPGRSSSVRDPLPEEGDLLWS